MSSMNEYRRMQYLEALGIESFVPRMLLPHAKPSLQCTFASPSKDQIKKDQAEDSSIGLGSEELTASEIKSVNEGLGAVLSALSLDEAKTNKKSASTATEKQIAANDLTTGSGGNNTENKEALGRLSGIDGAECDEQGIQSHNQAVDPTQLDAGQEAAEFELALWFTDTGLQIVDSRENGDALPTHQLLANILIAKSLLKTQLASAEIQRWPLPGTNLGDQSWSAASSMVFDFLTVRHELNPIRALVVCGESAAKVVLGADLDFASSLYSVKQSKSYDCEVLVLPALRDFLYSPPLKRRLWSALSALNITA